MRSPFSIRSFFFPIFRPVRAAFRNQAATGCRKTRKSVIFYQYTTEIPSVKEFFLRRTKKDAGSSGAFAASIFVK
ncbi:MAG TPA: hypothetical protein DEP43_02515 [Ruminococcaceae bacterium]|nr:hypothetical protein [Oscillospiraceae bacterium]HAO69772.1 hypothetical protein [Oscillospiraceae bacterium]HCB64824.1 hypothetical protein [Oscillospiraceae bacterium]